ncbi:MAG: FkbM family methyltransferase [Bryobacterales bacterium]|nr:FkbM family methyltransferase [Bryobacterales bacterium]
MNYRDSSLGSPHRRGIRIAAVAAIVAAGLMLWLGLRNPAARAHDFFRATFFPIGGPALSLLETPLKRLGVIGAGVYEIQPGVSLFLDPNDFIGNFVLHAGDWERLEWDLIAPRLPAAGVFVDVGAHVGTYSLKAAKAVGQQGRIIAIEPNPVTAAHLRQGIAASGRNNVTVVEAAAGDRRSRLKLFAAADANTGMASFATGNARRSSGPYEERSVEVDVLPLDEMLPPLTLPRLDVLKVDAEGAETMVLRGAASSINRFHPVIVVETIDLQLRELHSSVQELEDLLHSYGYTKASATAYNVL